MLETANFVNIDIPNHLIAKVPLTSRSSSKLLHFNKSNGCINHHQTINLASILRHDDVLVVNNTQVYKARLEAKRKSGAICSLLILNPCNTKPEEWLALVKPSKRLKVGEILTLTKNYELLITKKTDTGFVYLQSNTPMMQLLDDIGIIPLPPYLGHSLEDAQKLEKKYQSIFSKNIGAVAAPTASLHFDEALLTSLNQHKITIEQITLHVGYGTFQPLRPHHFEQNKLHPEQLNLNKDVALRLTDYKAKGRRIIAVGTTVVRTLESCFEDNIFVASNKTTELFIKPGFKFKAIDGMLTNFHLPQSSLILLVASFIGSQAVKHTYETAIKHQYRFYSFGDAMLIC